MKTDAPNDLQGRMIACQQRATMIGKALEAFASSDRDDPDPDALEALGAVALELAEEIGAIEAACVRVPNDAYFARHPEIARVFGQGDDSGRSEVM